MVGFNTEDYLISGTSVSGSVDPKIAEIKGAIAHINNPGDIHIPDWNAYIEREMQELVTSGKYTQAEIDLALATPDPKPAFGPIPEGGPNAGSAPINSLYAYRTDGLDSPGVSTLVYKDPTPEEVAAEKARKIAYEAEWGAPYGAAVVKYKPDGTSNAFEGVAVPAVVPFNDSFGVARPGAPGFDKKFGVAGNDVRVAEGFGVAAPYREVDAEFGGVAQNDPYIVDPAQDAIDAKARQAYVDEWNSPAGADILITRADGTSNGAKGMIGLESAAIQDFGTLGDTKFANLNFEGVNFKSLGELREDGQSYGNTVAYSGASTGVSTEAGRTA